MCSIRLAGIFVLYFNQIISSSLFLFTFYFIGIVFFLYQIIVVSKIEPVWDNFPEAIDFFTQSKERLSNLSFYAPESGLYFQAKPFATALIYKLADSDPYKMIMMQKLLYASCTIMFSLIVVFFLDSFIMKIVSFYLFLFMFSWFSISGWTNTIMNETTSVSMLFLWMGFLFLYLLRNSYTITTLFCVITLFFCFSGQYWSFMALIASLIIALYNYKYRNLHLSKNIFVLVFCIFVFYLQQKSVQIGNTNKLTTYSNLVNRVNLSSKNLNWFLENGMPSVDLINENNKTKSLSEFELRKYIIKEHDNPNFKKFIDWCASDGNFVYWKFILTNPSYLFLQDIDNEKLSYLTKINYKEYFVYTSKKSDLTERYLPFFGLYFLLFMTIVLIVLFYYSRSLIYLLPLFFIILFSINSIIVFNSNFNSVNRHLYINEILVQILSLFSILFFINYFIVYIKRKIYGI